MAGSFSGVSRVNTGELGPRFKFVLLTEPVTKGLVFVCACCCENAQHHTLLEATRWRHFSLRGVCPGVHVLFFLSGRRSLIHSCCVLPVFSFLVRISGWEPVALSWRMWPVRGREVIHFSIFFSDHASLLASGSLYISLCLFDGVSVSPCFSLSLSPSSTHDFFSLFLFFMIMFLNKSQYKPIFALVILKTFLGFPGDPW